MMGCRTCGQWKISIKSEIGRFCSWDCFDAQVALIRKAAWSKPTLDSIDELGMMYIHP